MKFLLVMLFSSQLIFSQLTKNELDQKINQIYSGKANLVLKELSSLKSKFPNDAGVLYLDAILTVNGKNSAKKFLEIADNFPSFEYRAEVLFKVYQFHYTAGEYITAEQIFNRLKNEYPESDYKRIESLETKISKPKDIKMFSIQCGAFGDKANAEKFITQLAQSNIKAVIKEKSSQPNLFFVVVEGFITIEEAQEFILKLKNENNISSIIFRNF